MKSTMSSAEKALCLSVAILLAMMTVIAVGLVHIPLW